MTRQLRCSIAGVLAGAVLVGCSATPSPDGAVRVEDRDGDFMLAIATPRLAWNADESIAVSAQLSYLGPGSVTVSGPGPGSHVAFEIVELTGTRRMEPAWLLACATWEMTRVPLAIPFHKSGGYTAEDPDAAFYEAWLAEPEFRLPAGRWKVSALAPFVAAPGCGGGPQIDLRAALVITVN